MLEDAPVAAALAAPRWVPDALRAPGPLEVAWWQWIGLLLAVPLLLLVSDLLRRVLATLLQRVAGWTGPTWDDEVIPRLRAPLRLVAASLLLPVLTTPLALPLAARIVVGDAARAIGLVAFVWGLLAAVTIGQRRLLARAEATGRQEAKSIIPLGARIVRILLLSLAVIAVAAQFGYPVGTILAGLGIGGIAIALGAQKTFENLLGSVAISVDRPFQVGDWIEADGISGGVEEIGLRSTRIRTNARTVITIPNGRLADQRIERHSARDRWLWNPTIRVSYDATVEQLARIVADVEGWLIGTRRVEVANVRFAGFGTHSFDIEVVSWFLTTDFFEFRQLRQDASFEVMRIVERHGARLAVPVQAVRLEGVPEGMGHPTPLSS